MGGLNVQDVQGIGNQEEQYLKLGLEQYGKKIFWKFTASVMDKHVKNVQRKMAFGMRLLSLTKQKELLTTLHF